MPMTFKYYLLIYAGDKCLTLKNKNVTDIESRYMKILETSAIGLLKTN